MFKLNLTQPGTIADYATKWESVTPNLNGVNMGAAAREYPQYTAISENQLLISGGYNNDVANKMQDQTIMFVANTSTWFVYSNYTEGIYGNRQM